MLKRGVLAVAAMVTFQTSFAMAEVSAETKAVLKGDLQYLGAVFSSAYAPRYWKQKHVSWNIEQELQQALAKVDSATNVFEYRAAVVDFLTSTQDYHVGFNFLATGVSTLPFMVRTVEGKTIVVWLNKEKLNPQIFPMDVGDEIVAVDGVPTQNVLGGLSAQISQSNAATDLALADMALTRRRAAKNLRPVVDPTTFTVKRQSNGMTVTVQLMWEVTPEIIRGFSDDRKLNIAGLIKTPQMKTPMLSDFRMNPDPTNMHWVGNKNSFLPEFGTPVWKAADDELFQAYIYEQDGKKVGYIRIPSYSPESTIYSAFKFSELVKKFQAETDALLIDQLNNPGGSVFYLYAMASMLTDTSLATPRHRMTLFPEDVKECTNILGILNDIKSDQDVVKLVGPSIEGYPTTFMVGVGIKQYCRFIIDQYNQGKRLSDPYYIFGVDRINPHPNVQYTKPIVVMINELDFSGGDFFPAILQDNKRATLVGSRTSGAGGYVLELKFTNSFGLEVVSFTGSLAERVDKNPIENLGVTPDVPIEMTAKDYQAGFVDYVSKVKAVVSEKLK
jgi:hypothetical protein